MRFSEELKPTRWSDHAVSRAADSMAHTSPQPGDSLSEFLLGRARSSSDSRLVADAVGGIVLVLTFGSWRVPGWYALVAVGVCFLGYGVWAIADREILDAGQASRARRLALSIVSLVAAATGVAGGIFLIMLVLARALGRIMS